jgi:hypothetical protein
MMNKRNNNKKRVKRKEVQRKSIKKNGLLINNSQIKGRMCKTRQKNKGFEDWAVAILKEKPQKAFQDRENMK